MEQLQSSRPWRKKINGPSVMARSDYNDVFGVPPWHTAPAPFSIRLDDYSEIFDATAFASIPVLDLSMVEHGFETAGDSAGAGGCRAGVDYLNIFGSIGGGGLAASYEEMFAEPEISAVSSSEGRTRWGDVLSERQGKEASEDPLKVCTANNELNFLRQSDDINSKKFSIAYHRMSQETIDDESKNKACNKGTVNNLGTKGNLPDGGQKNQEKIFAVNPPESNCGSVLDVPGDEKPNSQSHSSHSASRGHMLLHDVEYLKVSEISLETKPFKGPPPSRPPPTLSMKPEHLKILSADLRVDVEEGSSLKSKLDNQLHSSTEAAKSQTIEESIKGISCLHDAEMDFSSSAAVSIAAVKEAIEQAQVRLMSAKKLMDRKRAKSDWKVGLPKAMSKKEDGTADEVTLKNCSTGIVANNLLTTNSECGSEEIRTGVKIPLNHQERKMQPSSYRKDQQQAIKDNASASSVEREEIRNTGKLPLNLEDRKMQLPIYKKEEQRVRKENAYKSSELTCKIVDVAGEWRIDKEYYELLRNDRFFNTVKDIYIQGDAEKPKAAICSIENKENYGNNSEQAVEVEHQQKSMEVSVCIEKLDKDYKLKVPSIDGVEEANKNLGDAAMDEFLHKDHASELEEDYGSPLFDENQKQSEAHEGKNNENNANKIDSVVVCSPYKENINELGPNIFFEPWVANGNCEEKDLQAAERKINISHEKFEVNESNKELKVQNETLFHDMFEKEIKEPDELFTFNTTDEKEVVEEVKPFNYENKTRNMKHQNSCSAYRLKIEECENAGSKDESDEFQTNEEARILVENDLEQEAIQHENGLVNGLEMPEAQGEIKDAELEKILNSKETTCRKNCNEKESREVRTSLQKDDESVGALMNQDVKKSEFLASAEGVCGNRVSENITAVPVLVETHISSNSADEACQLGEIEESDTGRVFSSGKEGSLLATAPDATENSHDEKAGNYKHSLLDQERDGVLETYFEEKGLKGEKERERIAAQRENYEVRQQELAEARVRTERIAVERATAEARKRALAEALQKAEKTAEVEKTSREARLRAERAAVERVTEEARKRAIEKALAEKAAIDARERAAQVGAFNKDRLRNDSRTEHFKATRTQENSESKYKPTLAKNQRNAQSQTASSSANDHIYSDSHNNVGEAESKLSKARQEKQQQTAERAAKALAERNMRDILTQREQAQRDRLAESLDGDVRRWSSGKDGNLRALLSTLQYILGPDSGWQPIPLTDIMNASAAKKAYRKATLCVHPDKLQQRGASIQQKYICEKVFDLLQEAWNKFNSEER